MITILQEVVTGISLVSSGDSKPTPWPRVTIVIVSVNLCFQSLNITCESQKEYVRLEILDKDIIYNSHK